MIRTHGKGAGQAGMNELLHGGQVRQVTVDGHPAYVVADVVRFLTDAADPAAAWEELKRREPHLGRLVVTAGDPSDPVEVVDRAGLMRLIQSVESPKAERLKAWLARAAAERLEEAEDPELAVLRTRRLYEARGYSRKWVDKRLRGVSARHELTGEWYKRGAKESEQFRSLTNAIMQTAFGMDVEAWRRHKSLFKTGENLRDHMSDLELALVALAETTAVALHQRRDSEGFERLSADVKDAGEVVARTREEIERHTGRPVVESANHRGWWAGRRRARPENSPHPGSRAAVRDSDPERVQAEPEAEPPLPGVTPEGPGKAVA